MRKYVATLITTFLCTSVIADNQQAEPEQWYREMYSPIFLDSPAERLDEIQKYYADEMLIHSSEGETSRQDKIKWLSGLLAAWQGDGWLTSELKDLHIDRINVSTVSFKSSWVDHYEGAEDEISCGWYLAGLDGDQWKFTAYTYIDCAAHGL